MNRKIRTVILAGGLGTRLAPLTDDLPKPLVPVFQDSVLGHILHLLRRNGINDAVISTLYLSDRIENALGNCYDGVALQYVREHKPLGTAGGVAFALAQGRHSNGDEPQDMQPQADETVLVLSGDGICDFDLTAALAFHREKNADVTIVTTKSDNPLEYGVVHADKEGRILEFCEKPPWEQVISNTVNTGIYLIRRALFKNVPQDRPYDFAKDLFPLLMEQGRSLYACRMTGFWCDIGDLDEYFRCLCTALDGGIQGISPKGGYSMEELAKMGVSVTPPVWVDRSTLLSAGTKIGPYALIGPNSVIGAGCEIIRAVLHEHAELARDVKVRDAILAHHFRAGKGCDISGGCVFGGNCTLEHGAVAAGYQHYPAGSVVEGRRAEVNFHPRLPFAFLETSVCRLDTAEPLDLSARLGYALGKAALQQSASAGPVPAVGVMHDGVARSAAAAEAFLSGLARSGATSLSLGTGFWQLAEFAGIPLELEYTVFVSCKEGFLQAAILDQYGLPASKSLERAFSKSYTDAAELPQDAPGRCMTFKGLSLLYEMRLARDARFLLDRRENLQGLSFSICGNRAGPPAAILNKVLQAYGATCLGQEAATDQGGFPDKRSRGANRLGIWLENGKEAPVIDDFSARADAYHIHAVLIDDALKRGTKEFALPYLSPGIYRRMFGKAPGDIQVHRYLTSPNRGQNLSRRLMEEQLWLRDPCFAALRFCVLYHNSQKTVKQLLSSLPAFEVYAGDLDGVGVSRAEAMEVLSESAYATDLVAGTEREGVQLSLEDGRVTVIPKRSGGFRLISEAASFEAAKELCGRVEKLIVDNNKNTDEKR